MASFGSIVDCGSKPGGFSRMTFDVMQWIRKVKVNEKFSFERENFSFNIKVDSWQQKIEMELQKGLWCGYQSDWEISNSEIPYEKLLHASTNMKNPGIGLDTQSGMNDCLFISCHHILY